MENILDRHSNVALEFSGGRDSLACLYLLRPFLHRMTVYWVNTGAAFPETLSVIAAVRDFVPHFVEIAGNQPAVIEQFGIPTDVLPRSSTIIGLAAAQSSVRMQDSYSCCSRVIMVPLHQRVLGDGCTLIIRGQKLSDDHRAPITSGYVENGIEYLFPIERWSDADVDQYLADVGAPALPYYETMKGAPDCITCSGWWSENHGQYLRQHHPDAFVEYQRRLQIIAAEVRPHVLRFYREASQEIRNV